MDLLFKECERIAVVMEQFNCGEILLADSASRRNNYGV